MHIKKFTQFILENEYYEDINEGDIVPGVPFNSGLERSDKLGNMKDDLMWVDTKGDTTNIYFDRGNSASDKARDVAIHFPTSKKPAELKQGKAYAFISETGGEEKEDYFPAAITKIEDLTADKSSGQLYNASNSIDLLANFIDRSGIDGNSTAGANLAKVMTTLLLDPKYSTQVSDTFKKFATNIGGQISIKAFIPKMAAAFGNSGIKQATGMKAFVEEWPKSYAALSPKK
jgi:hypothetical protein